MVGFDLGEVGAPGQIEGQRRGEAVFEIDATVELILGIGVEGFEVAGGDRAGKKFMDALELATQAVSLGGVESLVSMPCSTTHMHWTAEERKAVGIGSGFIRLSVGIEDFEDLRADLEQALSQQS